MVGMFGEKVFQGQENGPDMELTVRGTELYSWFETLDGFPAIYDTALGLFCYGRLVDGAFTTTGTPVTSPPPGDLVRHVTEADEVRLRKIAERSLQLERRANPTPRREQ